MDHMTTVFANSFLRHNWREYIDGGVTMCVDLLYYYSSIKCLYGIRNVTTWISDPDLAVLHTVMPT